MERERLFWKKSRQWRHPRGSDSLFTENASLLIMLLLTRARSGGSAGSAGPGCQLTSLLEYQWQTSGEEIGAPTLPRRVGVIASAQRVQRACSVQVPAE